MPKTSSDVVCHKSIAYEVILPRSVRNGQASLCDSTYFWMLTIHLYIVPGICLLYTIDCTAVLCAESIQGF